MLISDVAMQADHPNNIRNFINTLPDPAASRAFLERLEALGSIVAAQDALLLSRMLTLASYSPFLGEILLRHPENITWLEAETSHGFDRLKSKEQLSEELARFVARIGEVDDATRLSRFKRRELLRVYLRDCLRIATLSEITEELSNLADVILAYGLARATQELVNLHGTPLTRDQRGRVENAEFAIAAMGKLGCRELNYASDIDLLFLYSGPGETAGDGRTAESIISNKEFFTAVAERVARMIGGSSDEGSVYRIDLRLRPYGRDGDLVWEIERAAQYYRSVAHNWERQALIRARAAAGSEPVVSRFLDTLRDVIFTKDALPDTLERVRSAKEKIERKEAGRMRGFNVKLGRGGIREIEFIAQALQLKHGGREPWVRSAQTLIVLARLAEKRYLSESERSKLSAAYSFLRTVEHRLQMEHGAQTHTLPPARSRLELLARRCGYLNDDPAQFLRDLETHTTAVRAVYNRVFVDSANLPASAAGQEAGTVLEPADDETARLVNQAVARIVKTLDQSSAETAQVLPGGIERTVAAALSYTINPARAVRNLTAWAESFATYTHEHIETTGWSVRGSTWATLIERLTLVLSSQYLSHLLVSRPVLASVLVDDHSVLETGNSLATLRDALSEEADPGAKTDALRRAWYRLIVEIGYRDMSVVSSQLSVAEDTQHPQEAQQQPTDHGPRTNDHLRSINLAQTALAEAVLQIAVEIALESVGVKGIQPGQLPFTILGLGRLGHAGMDYGSDLDLLVVFDDDEPWPAAPLALAASSTPQEFYARLTSRLVRVLSSITREGLLYRTDLRLRPEGKSGPVALGLGSLLAYIGNRASAWEHSAYLKAREVAGDLHFGARARKAICDACFESASSNESLREELGDVRARLVREKARGALPNIKWGRGGMTDVYFVTRYLQLRDRIYFPPQNGTTALITHLAETGSLDADAAQILFEGYTFLRRVDHWMRLLLDRPTPVLPGSSVALRDIARALGLSSGEECQEAFARHTTRIREVYDREFE